MDAKSIISQFSGYPAFVGVFAIDNFPKIKPLSGVVVNLQKANEQGSHWIALYCGELGTVELFEPLGFEYYPTQLQSLINQLHLQFKQILCNTISIQPKNSEMCGGYCIEFLKKRFSNISYGDVIQSFISYGNKNHMEFHI